MLCILHLFIFTSIINGFTVRLCSRPMSYRRDVANNFMSPTIVTFQLADLYPIEDFLKRSAGNGNSFSGVFAVVKEKKLQFIAASKDVSASVIFLMDRIPDIREMSIRVQSFSVANDDAMKSYKDELIRQCGTPSNQLSWEAVIKNSESINDRLDTVEADFTSSEAPEKKKVGYFLAYLFL